MERKFFKPKMFLQRVRKTRATTKLKLCLEPLVASHCLFTQPQTALHMFARIFPLHSKLQHVEQDCTRDDWHSQGAGPDSI